MEFIIDFWPYLILVFAIVSVGGYGLFSHAVKHTDGTDDIQTADGGQKGLMSSTHHSNIETLKSELDVAEADIVVIEADIVVIEADILALEVDVAAVEAEIIAARGSKASIDARLDVGIKENGDFKGLFGNFQDIAGVNHDYGLLRMECGKARLTFNGSESFKMIAITFGTPFAQTPMVQATVSINSGLTPAQMRTDAQAQNPGANGIGALIFYVGDGTNPDNGDYVDVDWLAIGVA